MTPAYKPFSGITVTVPNDSNPHSLLGLLKAVDPLVAPRTKYLVVQVDKTSGDVLRIGEGPTDSQGNNNPAKLTSTNCGAVIEVGGSETFQGFNDEDFSIATMYVMTGGAGTTKLNVMVRRN